MDKLNDPVFGDLEYNKEEGYWTKKIDFTLFGFEKQIDLMVTQKKRILLMFSVKHINHILIVFKN